MKLFHVFIFLFLLTSICYPQIENVSIEYPVYDFLREMTVKKIINFDEDNPNLSRFEIANFLKTIDSKKIELSSTEIKILNKYKVEFIPEEANKDNTWQMFGSGKKFLKNLEDFFSNKQKYIFTAGKPGSNAFVEGIGNVYAGTEFKPDNSHNTLMMDGGFRARGTIFNHLGYSFDFSKGAIFGNKELAPFIEPKLRTDFKYNEDSESLKNYDFTNAYLKFYIEPDEGMGLSAQFGREKLTYGYGYGSKPILSGDNPNMDFLKLNFNYGIVRFSSIFASTVGYMQENRDDRYTKYFSAHRLKVAIPDIVDLAISDVVVYNGRIEFAYLNPIILWHFAEKSLQDRDNKNFIFDFKTKFLKNAEFQGTFFVDDDEQFAILSGGSTRSQKYVYQFGAMIYEPIIKNLSLTVEYTKIRPFTYTHYDIRDNYTAYGVNLGHRIGPNADELFSRITYNISSWGRINLEYSHVRKGNNIYDANGILVTNVGGDIAQGHRTGIDPEEAPFLAGNRVNTDAFGLNFRWIPIRNYIFDFYYGYTIENHITDGFKKDFSFGYIRMNVEY
ncbi:MAG: capsule assembly Wzi family protein [Candidatus Kapaibacterium sp.]